MKENVRRVPGSIRSRRAALSRLAALPSRCQLPAESTYKMQTKRRQNRKCDFISDYESTTYDVHTVKCLHLPAAHSSLCRNKPGAVAETHGIRTLLTGESCPLSLGLWRRSLSPRTEPASVRVRASRRSRLLLQYCTPKAFIGEASSVSGPQMRDRSIRVDSQLEIENEKK